MFDIMCWFLVILVFMVWTNCVFGFLDAKPCRTIMKLHQKVSSGIENYGFSAPTRKAMPNHLEILSKIIMFCYGKTCFLDSSTQNHAESSRNLVKNSALDPKRAKLTKSLVSGIWFLSPEAGGTLRRQLGYL